MIWIFAAILIALAALSPGFRRFGLALAGVAIILIIILILINDRSKKPSAPMADVPAPAARQKMMDHDEYVLSMQDKKDPDATHRIALTEVRFGEITPAVDTPSAGPPGGATPVFRSVQARLYNDSPRFTLTNYSYDLTVQDCVLERCTTVYEQRQQGLPVLIPPNQARDVTIPLKPDPGGSIPFKLIGKARIQLTCNDVRAYQTPDGLQPLDASVAAGPK